MVAFLFLTFQAKAVKETVVVLKVSESGAEEGLLEPFSDEGLGYKEKTPSKCLAFSVNKIGKNVDWFEVV
ncbi:hypothetical protein C1N50_18725 [Vibrio campbellii]|nr:hypothetical protein C1N50_18725 [Vibrio campbellii]